MLIGISIKHYLKGVQIQGIANGLCYMHNLVPSPLYHGDVKGVSLVVFGPLPCLTPSIPVQGVDI